MPKPSVCPHVRHFHTCLNLTDGVVGCCNIPECSDGMDGRPNTEPEPANITLFYNENLAQKWHACPNATTLPFMVCCKSDPLSQGCPREESNQALIINGRIVTSSLVLVSEPSRSSTAFPWSPPSTSASFHTSTSVLSNTPAVDVTGQSALRTEIAATRIPYASASKSNPTAIAGGVTGGIVGLALLVGLLVICCRRRHIRPQHDMNEGGSLASGSVLPDSTQLDHAELEAMKQGASSSQSYQLSLRPCRQLIVFF